MRRLRGPPSDCPATLQVCLCVNLSRKPYLVNGSRGIVVGFTDGEEQLQRLKVRRPLPRPVEWAGWSATSETACWSAGGLALAGWRT